MEVALVCWPGYCSVVEGGCFSIHLCSPGGPESGQLKGDWTLVRKCHVNTDGNNRVRNKPAQGQNVGFGDWGWEAWQEIILEDSACSTSRISEPKVLDTCCHPGRQATGAHGSGWGRQRLQVLAGHTRRPRYGAWEQFVVHLGRSKTSGPGLGRSCVCILWQFIHQFILYLGKILPVDWELCSLIPGLSWLDIYKN